MRERETGGGKNDDDTPYDRTDYISLVDTEHFSVKTLDMGEQSIKYREWSKNHKEVHRGAPGGGKAANQAITWAERSKENP